MNRESADRVELCGKEEGMMSMNGLIGRCYHHYNVLEMYDGQTIPNSGHVSLKSKPQDTGKATGVTVERRMCKYLVRRRYCI